VELNAPALLLVKLTRPVGTIARPPGVVSVTVAVHVVLCFTVTVPGTQSTLVAVERLVTVIVVLPELPK